MEVRRVKTRALIEVHDLLVDNDIAVSASLPSPRLSEGEGVADPHLFTNNLAERDLGAVMRLVHEYFPRRCVFEVTGNEDELADHYATVNVTIWCKSAEYAYTGIDPQISFQTEDNPCPHNGGHEERPDGVYCSLCGDLI